MLLGARDSCCGLGFIQMCVMAMASLQWRPPQLHSSGLVLNSSKHKLNIVSIWRRYLRICNVQRRKFQLRASEDENADNTSDAKRDQELKPKSSENPPEEEASKVISGSPLPGVKAPLESIKISRADLDVIRNQVFSFDTFFPTEQEFYEAGVIFRGNLRGEAAKSYAKVSARLQEKFGDEYKLFLLSDLQDDKPTAAVVRSLTLKPQQGVVPDWFATGAFGIVTLGTLLLRNSPELQLSFIRTGFTSELVLNALPGALTTLSILLVHEAGHYFAAKRAGATLSWPYFIPSWQLGTFGGITKVLSVLKNRTELIEIASSGPLAGAILSLSIVCLGLLFPPQEGQGLVVNASIFHESFLVGGLAKILLGEGLQEGATLTINPIVLSAWSALLINAINCIPVGELDGGLISQGLWGRKIWSRVNGVSVALLGFSGLFSDVALYWVVLIIFLQRGPIAPQADEISPPSSRHVLVGVCLLLLSLLVCFPFPFVFSSDVTSLTA